MWQLRTSFHDNHSYLLPVKSDSAWTAFTILAIVTEKGGGGFFNTLNPGILGIDIDKNHGIFKIEIPGFFGFFILQTMCVLMSFTSFQIILKSLANKNLSE